jgi:iron(III) transport system substrate-binding protein
MLPIVILACESKPKNSVVIYSSNSEEQVREIVGGFEAETGIKVEMISAVTGEVFKRIKSERNNPYADVSWGGVDSIYKDNLDLFDEYVSQYNDDLLPEYRNIAGKVTIYCLDGSVLLVNKNRIGDIKIDGYASLLNSELKGNIIMGDPSASGSAFAHLINMLMAMGGGAIDSPAGWDYVRELLAINGGKIGSSSGAVHKSVADGEYAVAVTYEDPSVTYFKSGAPVEVVYMKEGVVFNTSAMGVVKGAKHLENARKFIDFVTSKQGQDIYGTKTATRPIREDAQLGGYMKPMSEINTLHPDYDYIGEHRNEILDKYKAIFTANNG